MNKPLQSKEEIRAILNKEIKAIRDLGFAMQDQSNATPKEYDALAREIKSHTDCIKDLAFELSRPQPCGVEAVTCFNCGDKVPLGAAEKTDKGFLCEDCPDEVA